MSHYNLHPSEDLSMMIMAYNGHSLYAAIKEMYRLHGDLSDRDCVNLSVEPAGDKGYLVVARCPKTGFTIAMYRFPTNHNMLEFVRARIWVKKNGAKNIVEVRR